MEDVVQLVIQQIVLQWEEFIKETIQRVQVINVVHAVVTIHALIIA